MTFTVGIPVHNGVRYLRSALDSALSQLRPADEILVIDDASTDGSAELLQSDKYRMKFRLLRNAAPTGFVDAWNRVIDHSVSDFVTILHQDDLLDPRYLQQIESALNVFPQARHIYSGYTVIDHEGRELHTSPLPHSSKPILFPGREYAHQYLKGVLANAHIHRCPGVTTERKLLLEKCSYRREAGLIADDDFFLRVGEFTDVVGISQPLSFFRIHRDSATGRLASLSHKLAEDYLFQTRYYRSHQSILDDADIRLVEGQAIRFINSYLLESMLGDDSGALEEAKKLKGEFEKTLPGYFRQHSTVVVRALWRMIERTPPGSVVFSALSKGMGVFMRLKKILFP
jgi:glycosyltransferase involved in cell wall biosynthesis